MIEFFSNILDYIQLVFDNGTNRWLASSGFAIIAFLIINGRWRKEKFLERWRPERDKFFRELSLIEDDLINFQELFSGVITGVGNFAVPDWKELFKYKESQIARKNYWLRNPFTINIFSKELLTQESAYIIVFHLELIKGTIEDIALLIDKGFFESDYDISIRHVQHALSGSESLQDVIKKMKRNSDFSDFMYASLVPFMFTRLVIPMINRKKMEKFVGKRDQLPFSDKEVLDLIRKALT